MNAEKSEVDESSFSTENSAPKAKVLLEEMVADIICHGPVPHSIHKVGNLTAFTDDLHTHVITRLYKTKTQQILSLLWSQVKNLCEGNYVGTQGVCATTMVGAKGIGKTATLKLFNATAKYEFQKLIELYINMNNVLVNGCPMQKH